MIQGYEGFYAIQNEMPPEKHPLRIGGTILFSTGGYSARLEERSSDGGANQLMLHLNIVVTSPSGPVPEVITRVELPEFVMDDPPFRYEEVEFHLVGIEGDPPPRMEIDRPV